MADLPLESLDPEILVRHGFSVNDRTFHLDALGTSSAEFRSETSPDESTCTDPGLRNVCPGGLLGHVVEITLRSKSSSHRTYLGRLVRPIHRSQDSGRTFGSR